MSPARPCLNICRTLDSFSRVSRSSQRYIRTCSKLSIWVSPRDQKRYDTKRSIFAPLSLSVPTYPKSHSQRHYSSSPASQHGHIGTPRAGEERKVTFIDKDGHSHTFTVSDGDNLLDIAQAHDLEMEGACGGSCACSTCHVIVEDDNYYEKMPEPDDDENDMLDLAFGLTETSRLGCQVKMTRDLDGVVVKLPSMTRNMQASDFK